MLTYTVRSFWWKNVEVSHIFEHNLIHFVHLKALMYIKYT